MRNVQFGFAVMAMVAWSGLRPAMAQEEPFGPNIGSWQFTQSFENNAVNCRAKRFSGKNLDIMAMNTKGQAYFSVNANVINGQFPNSTLRTSIGDFTVNAWTTNGRLVFSGLNGSAIDEIAHLGSFFWILSDGSNRSGNVVLGTDAVQVFDNVAKCVRANS